MAETMRVNEEHFTHLFLLALWWQSSHHEKPVNRHATVDAVARVFVELGVLKPALKKTLRKDGALQRHFRRHLELCIYSGEDESVAAQHATVSRWFFVRHDIAQGDIDRERMLRDKTIYISAAGEKKAAEIEARYAGFLTRETYLAKRREIEARFADIPDAGRAAMGRGYRRRVENDED